MISPRTPLFSRILSGAVLLYAAGAATYIGLHPEQYQWDFKIYYSAIGELQAGHNPYELLYLYPPLTLWVFSPFSLFTQPVASVLYLILKSIAFLFLLSIWRKEFLPSDNNTLLPVFLLFAFNATIYTDYAAGNISVFEQLFLWLAFSFLLKNRIAWFCTLVIIAASFKLTPLLFLFLLPLFNVKRSWYYVSLSLGIFAGFLFCSYLLFPSLFHDYLANLHVEGGRGAINPTVFAFASNISEFIGRSHHMEIPGIVPIAAYLCISTAVLFIARRPLAVLARSANPRDRLTLVFFVCVLTALILPRFKDYSYILLLVPTYSIILQSNIPRSRSLLLLLTMLSAHIPLPGLSFISKLWGYYPLFIAGGVFLLYVREILSSEAQATKS